MSFEGELQCWFPVSLYIKKKKSTKSNEILLLTEQPGRMWKATSLQIVQLTHTLDESNVNCQLPAGEASPEHICESCLSTWCNTPDWRNESRGGFFHRHGHSLSDSCELWSDSAVSHDRRDQMEHAQPGKQVLTKKKKKEKNNAQPTSVVPMCVYPIFSKWIKIWSSSTSLNLSFSDCRGGLNIKNGNKKTNNRYSNNTKTKKQKLGQLWQ